MLLSMRKRRSVRVSSKVYKKILDFCVENNISMSRFIEDRIKSYEEIALLRFVQGNWSTQESWILIVTYDGDRSQEKDMNIQIHAGKRGGYCENGLSFIFDDRGMSNEFLAKEAKKRILRNVQSVSAGAWRCRLDHGMG